MSKIEQFKAVFQPLYGASDKRWPSFEYIADKLFALERPVVIIETGSTRNPSNFNGDGCASLLWNYIAKETKGVAVSIDIDITASAITGKLCPYTRTITSDSITALRGYLPRPIDLIYLDSYDFMPGEELNSCFHQLGEIGAIWNRLPEGSLIASDDSIDERTGKPALTRQLFKMLGLPLLIDGYVPVWQKVSPTPKGS